MGDPRHTNPARVIQVGPDRVTLLGEEAIIEAKHPMPDWDVRELNPIPIYLDDKKFLLVRKGKASPPFSTRYHLLAWPEGHISNNSRFHTYDAQTVAERDSVRREAKLQDFIGLFLFPLYPFIGLLWSGTQLRLTRFGVVPRAATGASIFLVFCLFIVQIFLCVGLLNSSAILLVGGAGLLLAMLADMMVRYANYLRDHEWFGGFLEWRMPPARDSQRSLPAGSPGFFASLETVLWNLVENIPAPVQRGIRPAINLPPVIERELRVALRKQKPARTRLRMGAACIGAALVLALVGGRTGGRNLHQWLCFLACFAIMSAPARIAGVFAAERREQTLGLLFFSGLNVLEVFVSKTFSAGLVAFTDLLAIVPVLALPFLMGGVSFELFLATVFSLPNLLFFALSISLLASILNEDEGSALVSTFILAFVLCAIPPAFYLAHRFFSSHPHPLPWLLRCSPAYGPWLLFHPFGPAQQAEFWRNFVITLGWSLLCLALAALALTRLWRRFEQPTAPESWFQRWQGLCRGTPGSRRRLAAEQLETTPFAWLAARNRQPAATAWLITGSLICLWVLCWVLWGARWASIPNFFITATLLNLALRWISHHTAAAGLGLPRSDGSYELLLTTPLNTREIVAGQLEALRHLFRPIGLAVLAFEGVLMVAGLALRPWSGWALFVYGSIWASLMFWTWKQSWDARGALLSMWAGLNSGRPVTAAWRAFGFNSWVWIWLLFNLRHGWRGFSRFPSGSVMEVVALVFAAVILIVVLVHSRGATEFLEQRLANEFREIVREPLPDPNDQRFKQWQIRERFPWG